MIEILGGFYDGTGNDSEMERISALEKLYFSAALGATFRSFEGEVKRARVRLGGERAGGYLCEIEVDTTSCVVYAGGCGTSRASAFARASEQLDRRLFSELSGGSSSDAGPAAMGRIAA